MREKLLQDREQRVAREREELAAQLDELDRRRRELAAIQPAAAVPAEVAATVEVPVEAVLAERLERIEARLAEVEDRERALELRESAVAAREKAALTPPAPAPMPPSVPPPAPAPVPSPAAAPPVPLPPPVADAVSHPAPEPAPEPGLAPAPEPAPEPEPEPAPAPVAVAPVPSSRLLAPLSLPALERLVALHADEFPDRVDEWKAYLHYLREYSDVHGRVGPGFEWLITDVFADLLERRDSS